MSDNTSKVEQQLRHIGFKVLIGFVVVISAVIIIAKPSNTLIAWTMTSCWLLLAILALSKPAYDEWFAKVWVLVSVPLIPTLIFYNGIIPASLISLATIFPVMLVKGYWRLFSVIIIACSTLMVPLSDVPYDNAIWLRLSISNALVAIMVLTLVTFLEKALVASLDKSDELNKSLLSEQQASETQAKFLATMSHEIRTPMNGILGLLDVLLSSDMPVKQRSLLDKIKYSGDVLHRILNDILDLSKLSAGKLIIEKLPINIQQLLIDSIAIFDSQAQKKGLYLTFITDPKIKLSLLGDPTRITQVINNLVSNAIKFTSKGMVTISVEISQETEDMQSLKFCVSDTGMGISQEYLANIFAAFSQADDSTARKFGGTGLGLQIAKSLVEQMSGEMWVESEEQVGSAFYFTLSLELSSETPININNIEQTRSQYTGNVLVAEDNEINQVVAQQTLLSYGLDVDLVDDGQKCLEAMQNKNYDLIFMDLHMPNVDGFQACVEIRKANTTIPVVALTAAVLKDEIQKALDSGMNAHLSKPLDHVQLNLILNKYLNLGN
jgi:signal transduction histidine kinase/CheY-like chemotaxis protein